MSRRISADTRLGIAQSYAKGCPTKIITYEFGIGKSTLTSIVRGAGIPLRHRYYTRNDLTPDLRAKAVELFRAGRDTLTIARLLSVTEAAVANALSRIRDAQR